MITKTKQYENFIEADLATRVRLAMPLARELAILGPSDSEDELTADRMALSLHVEELLGGDPVPATCDGKTGKAIDQREAAAYALGIAVGLMLRPEVFAKGGAR